MAEDEISKSKQITQLSKELLDDIELDRLSPDKLLLKVTRLARLTESERIQKWLTFEMVGYTSKDMLALEYMGYTGRWIDLSKGTGYWGPLAQQDAQIKSAEKALESTNMPNTSGDKGTWVIANVIAHANALRSEINQLSAIRSKVIALMHAFVSQVYYEKLLSGLAESLFENFREIVDPMIAESAEKILEKLPFIEMRLSEGVPEAISQAMNTCRRLIDAFADAVAPSETAETVLEDEILKTGPQHHLNRLTLHIADNTFSKSRRKRIKQSLRNVYERVSAGVHSDISTSEAKALLLHTYLLLGEIVLLAHDQS
ncbi:MAG: hypothetical protein ABIJ61_02865 [bacterium]